MKKLITKSTKLILILCLLYITSPQTQSQALVDFDTDSALIDGTVVISEAYSLPEDVGVAGHVLTTNGSGQSAWMSLPTAPSVSGTFVYMTPYVCGALGPQPFPVISDRNDGQYQTSISISNPAHGAATLTRYITHTHEVADSLVPPDSIRAPGPTILSDALPRFYAFAMTCAEVYDMLGYTPDPVTPVFEGYVIIESDEKLAVSATYTYYDLGAFLESVNQGGGGGLGIGNSIDIEQIEPIFVPSPPPVE